MNHLRFPGILYLFFIVVSAYGYRVYHQRKSKDMDSGDFIFTEAHYIVGYRVF